MLGELRFRELPFEQIPDEVTSGRADAGLLIHEGQLTFSDFGLVKLLDLGEWWLLETGLPLPLGVNVARRDIGEDRLRDLSQVFRDAIQCGLDNRDEALDYALQFGRGIDAAVADRFVEMYVNELTQDYGDEGRKAVSELLAPRRGDRCVSAARRARLHRLTCSAWRSRCEPSANAVARPCRRDSDRACICSLRVHVLRDLRRGGPPPLPELRWRARCAAGARRGYRASHAA